ncbi:MAG: glycoside hydrolase family 2 [Clostridia bacterium]|nr:glycoside hydrolase family 2 [Clostridia bacterium]
MKKEKLINLPSKRPLTGDVPHDVYPRPQLKRDSFFCLNGEWEFSSSDGEEPTVRGKILVPFPRESALSGACEWKGKNLYYRKKFTLPDGFEKGRVILHVGAADQQTYVTVNGTALPYHRGGYLSFSFDITDYISRENELFIKVVDDPADKSEPYGKQCVKRGGMWYTPVSGIWQTVWIECVPNEYIEKLIITPNEKGASIMVKGINEGVVKVDGEGEYKIEKGRAEIVLQNPEYWSPENPRLYRFTVEAGEDKVESYFAVRTLEIKEVDGIPRLCLNGKPYFFNGLLDQGYFSDGIYTPADLASYTDDIEFTKRLGFNMLRKHIKIEPEYFYYECDRLGIVVFQDMVNNGGYSFLFDTALPTIGLKKKSDKRKKDKTFLNFMDDMRGTVDQLYNHPSVCLWTIFNEGWGQANSSFLYRELRKYDPTRFIDSASGWFKGGENDVVSEHVYFKPYKFRSADRPVFLSEFGGYAHRVEGHVFNPDKQYGYRKIETREQLLSDLRKLYETEVIPAVERGLCAAVYTQLSDVEDETNGLITYDRMVEKVDARELRKLFENIN